MELFTFDWLLLGSKFWWFFFLFQSFEEQREQFKELLKDKEDEIQMLAAEREAKESPEEIDILNNQVLICPFPSERSNQCYLLYS